MRLIDADDFFKQFPELDTEPYNDLSPIFTQEDIDNVLELAYISGQQHPERPKGKWINFNSYFRKCSLCQKIVGFDYIEQNGERFNFCPNCGARIEGDA